MTEIITHKKESPLVGLVGGGGGPTGLGLAGLGITPDGQELFYTKGTYSWVCPVGVTSISVVVIGAGGASGGGELSANGNWIFTGGGGGACAYKNNISVSPGTSYTVVVGSGSANSEVGHSDGGDSYFINATTLMAKGGHSADDSGRDGGNYAACVGDGAYSGGAGGNGEGYGGFSSWNGSETSTNVGTQTTNHRGVNDAGGAGGQGGGGGGGRGDNNSNNGEGGTGGGVGAFIGAGGGGGEGHYSSDMSSRGGGGGGGGSTGASNDSGLDGSDSMSNYLGIGGVGGRNGGGSGSGNGRYQGSGYDSRPGAVRIIWSTSGTTRNFPATNIGDV